MCGFTSSHDHHSSKQGSDPHCWAGLSRWDDLKKPEFLSINPEGRIPVLRDGDVRMVESGAITQWLVDKYGQGKLTVPKGTAEHALYCQVRRS